MFWNMCIKAAAKHLVPPGDSKAAFWSGDLEEPVLDQESSQSFFPWSAHSLKASANLSFSWRAYFHSELSIHGLFKIRFLLDFLRGKPPSPSLCTQRSPAHQKSWRNIPLGGRSALMVHMSWTDRQEFKLQMLHLFFENNLSSLCILLW